MQVLLGESTLSWSLRFFSLKKKKRFNFKHIFHPAASCIWQGRREPVIHTDDQAACLRGKFSVGRSGARNLNWNSPISILIPHLQEDLEVGAHGISLAPVRSPADFSWELCKAGGGAPGSCGGISSPPLLGNPGTHAMSEGLNRKIGRPAPAKI